MEGHIYVRGDIGQDFSRDVEKQLQSPDVKNASDLVVHISSRGGSVYEGYTVYHLLKATGKPITSIIEGQAQSMATFIALAGKKVIMLNPSVFMIHNPSQGLEGDADALQGGSAELRKIEDEMAAAYAAKTKLPIEKIKEMMKAETSMNATEAKNLGFVDEIKSHLKAVAYGKTKMKKSAITQLATALSNLVGGGPVALDLTLQDGTTILTSDAASEDMIMGSNVTIAGAVAPDGDYTTTDGMVISVVGGKVTNIVDPTDAKKAAAPAPAETAEQKVARLTAELAALKATAVPATTAKVETPEEKIARLEAEMTTIKAETEKVTADAKASLEGAVKMLAEQKKKQTVGDAKKPDEGLIPMRTPVSVKRSGPNAQALDATKTFLAQEMSWIKRYYPIGYFDNYEVGGPNAISIVEPNFTFTYPGILTTDIFYKPTLSSPALSDLFTIDQGISFQKQYNVVPGLSKILKPYTGCGASNSNGSRVQIGAATLTTKEFRMQEKWCKDDFTQQLTGVYNNLAQEWLKTGEKSFDPAGTPMDTVIMDLLTDALRRDVFVRATMAAGNSSSADFNQIDGLWDRLIDSSGQSNYCVVRANSSIFGGSALGTGTLAAGVALTNLELCYQKSNDLLKEQFDKAVFWVTGSVYDNYVQSLVGTGNVSQAQFENLMQGVGGKKTWQGGVTYKGIPVYPVRLWDSSLADSSNPLNATTRHLILLTVKQNHMLGLENGADLNNIYSWYENKDSARYYRTDMKMGYQYLHCDLQTIAY